MDIVVALVAFTVALVFGLGGLGSAAALIPILVFMGYPFPMARAAGLFTNFVSTSSLTINNLLHGRVKPRSILPLVATSITFAPIGAYTSFVIPERIVGALFTLFLIFAGFTVFLPKRVSFRDCPAWVSATVGAIAGFFSGMLGIGGGIIISPSLMLYGVDPKIVTSVTAFAVPFSSMSSFLTYLRMGGVDWDLTLSTSLPAAFAGYLAGHITHSRLSSEQVRRILGLIFIVLAIRFAARYV